MSDSVVEQGGAVATLLVNIDVAEIEKAIAFYCAGLGLRVRRRLGPNTAELVGASSPIFLTQQPAGTLPFHGASSPRTYRRHWTPVHVDFVVAELESAVNRAESAGATLEGEVHASAWWRYVVMADPFGNGFCVLQFTGKGYGEGE